MAKFCRHCGKSLADGEVCSCTMQAPAAAPQAPALRFCPKCSRPLAQGEICNCERQTPPARPAQQPRPVQQAIYCPRCGRQVPAGRVCSCQLQTPDAPKAPVQKAELQEALDKAKNTAGGVVEKVKNHMGIGEPELNKGDAFEKGKQIIPDCVKANEGEVPVKQYEVATLRTRILGIPFTKAIGRMQVTNKRVIFRAPGRCIAGRTTLQHEFAIDEVAGIEARREYVFSVMNLIIGILVTMICGIVTNWLVREICSDAIAEGEFAGVIILSMLFGLGGCVPFAFLKKKWLLKLAGLGAAFMPALINGMTASKVGEAMEAFGLRFFGGVLVVVAVLAVIMAVFALFIYAIIPNLVLRIKTKSATDAINISRKKTRVPVPGSVDQENTGYMEVIPFPDAEFCIRQINAMVTDIQKLGDFGIEKWKN